MKRFLGKTIATVTLGTGLALAASPVLAQPADARAISTFNEGSKSLCYWDGKAYSPGGKTVFLGEVYVCQSDGTWKKEGPAPDPRFAMRAYAL